MKLFEIITYPICGGIAVAVVINIFAKTEKQAIKKAAKKYSHFCVNEVKYINYNGTLYANDVVFC